MVSFSERLAAAKAAPRPTKDVQVILDAGLGQRIEDLRAELVTTQQEEAADERLAQSFERSEALQVKLDYALGEAADQLVTLRFTQVPAAVWADACSRSPLRLGVPVDEHYGYNVDQIAVLVAPLSGVRVEDGEEIPLVVQAANDDSPAVDEWRDLFAAITGHEIRKIGDVIFELNEFAPAKQIEAAKKASAIRQG